MTFKDVNEFKKRKTGLNYQRTDLDSLFLKLSFSLFAAEKLKHETGSSVLQSKPDLSS